MKKFYILFVLFMGIVDLSAQNSTHVIYSEDASNFPNPGRGFYRPDNNLNSSVIANYRNDGISLVLVQYHLDDFIDTIIPVWYLRNIQEDFNKIRTAGLKVILRFSYTARTTSPYQDAPPDIVMTHINQLAPLLKNNSDVIFTLQAGFIGSWGEWYYTDYFSTSPGVITDQNWVDRRMIVNELLNKLPPEIMVCVRTPDYKRHLLEKDDFVSVTPEEAFKELTIARIAHHNDCFLATVNDMGTYIDTTVEKPYLANDTRYTVIGGETCAESTYSHCDNAVKELKRFHWSYINEDYHQGVLNDWINEGCYDEIQKKVGYRFRMIDGEFTKTSNQGGDFVLKLNIINDGFANPTNPMSPELILRNKLSGKEYMASISGDIRFWSLDDTIHLNLGYGLPINIEQGDYDLLLNISDAHGTLKDNPYYSIRMANVNVWEEESGYNSLNHTLTIDNSLLDSYTGSDFFKIKNMAVSDISIVVDGLTEDWDSIPAIYYNANQNAHTLKAWNTQDSLYLFIGGGDFVGTIAWYINADNDSVTGINSFDYKLTDAALYFANGNTWETIPDIYINSSFTNEAKEVAISIDNLIPIPIGDRYRVLAVDNTDYLPNNGVFPEINRIMLFSPPTLKIKKGGNINTLYWNKNYNSATVKTVIERSQTLGNYNVISTQSNNTISFQDINLEENSTNYYRIRQENGNNVSGWSNPVRVETEGNEMSFIYIHLDGNPSDWNLCKPVATGEYQDSLQVLRFFNQNDTLFYSIENTGDTLTSYQLFFNVDALSGFEYKISNDTLFLYQNGNWGFSKQLQSFKSFGFIEAGINLSDIGMENKDFFTASLWLNNQNVWGENQEFEYLKYETLASPKGFDLKMSVDDPFGRIKVEWQNDSNPDGYVIERSLDDSLHFLHLTETSNSTFYYLDNDVDTSHVYFYRMYSFKDILRSPFTKILWMRPGFTGIHEIKNLNCIINVFPNPINSTSTISVIVDNPDNIVVELYNLYGIKIKTLFKGSVVNEETIIFFARSISSGTYLLVVRGKRTSKIKKIVVSY